MLVIRTIADFRSLSQPHQVEIQQALRTKERLEEWLVGLNRKRPPAPPSMHPGWLRCKGCMDSPGWVPLRERNNADIHPSQVNACVKAIWYACSGFTDPKSGELVPYANFLEKNIPAKLRMIFDLGHAWHHTVQGYGESGAWGDCGYKAEIEIDPDDDKQPIAQRYWIRGSLDAELDHYIVTTPSLGQVSIRVIHEYKTISSGGYTKLTKPKPEHKWQAMMYAAVRDVPLLVFLYINKDNSQLADYVIPFDDMLWQEIALKIDTVQYWADQGQPPPWELTSAVKDKAECRECGFRKICNPPTGG